MANVQKDEARPPAADEGNFYNMVRVWYMVSETHTIFLKYKYGNNFTITIEKKIPRHISVKTRYITPEYFWMQSTLCINDKYSSNLYA